MVPRSTKRNTLPICQSAVWISRTIALSNHMRPFAIELRRVNTIARRQQAARLIGFDGLPARLPARRAD
jgi:hypothetical protein